MTDSDHIMQLRQQVANLHGLLLKAQAERDHARRDLCSEWAARNASCCTKKGHKFSPDAQLWADIRGWDCFKEEPR